MLSSVQLVDQTCSSCKGRGTYEATMKCLNCGWQGTVRLSKGHQVEGWNRECPACECRGLFHVSS